MAASDSRDDGLLIVGIGASAGGLEACSTLLSHLPTDTGMGFVLVQHLSAGQESLLREVLARTTSMQVNTAENGMVAESQAHRFPYPG